MIGFIDYLKLLMKNKEKNNMLVGDMAIENFADLPDFEDLPKNMQV